MEKPYISLQPSEAALLTAAASVYSAYIVSGKVSDGNIQQMLHRSFDEVLALANHIEESVQSDREMG